MSDNRYVFKSLSHTHSGLINLNQVVNIDFSSIKLHRNKSPVLLGEEKT